MEKSSAFSGFDGLTTAAELLARRQRAQPRPVLVTRLPLLDGGAGGLPRGIFLELCGGRSSGRFALALAVLAAATANGEASAFIDIGDHLDPQAAAAAGVDLARLLWARPTALKPAALSAEALLDAGVGVVVMDAGLPPREKDFLPAAAWLRLSRAAESRQAIFVLISSRRLAGAAAHAVISARDERAVWLRQGGAPPLLAGLKARWSVHRRNGHAEGGETGALELPAE